VIYYILFYYLLLSFHFYSQFSFTVQHLSTYPHLNTDFSPSHSSQKLSRESGSVRSREKFENGEHKMNEKEKERKKG
jgi:hypothetical protein